MTFRSLGVLFVEDDPVARGLVLSLLQSRGHRVHLAPDGESALKLLQERGDDLDWLLTDIRLPGAVDGFQVAERYRTAFPRKPVVYTSRLGLEAEKAVAGSSFVRKPFRAADLVVLANSMRMQASVARQH